MSEEKANPQWERIKQLLILGAAAAAGAIGVELGLTDAPPPDCGDEPTAEAPAEEAPPEAPEPAE